MAMVGFGPPDTGVGTKSYEYLYKQNEWLSYMFANIDEDNLSEAFAATLQSASDTGAAAVQMTGEMSLAIVALRKELKELRENTQAYLDAITTNIAAIIASVEALDARLEALETEV